MMEERTRYRRLGMAVLLLAMFVSLRYIVRVAAACWSEWQQYAAEPHHVPVPLDSSALGLRSVSFRSRDGALLRGWYVLSRRGTAVVVCHGDEADRSSMLPEARALAAAGFGVLLFDFPGHGESTGNAHSPDARRAALQGAVDFLTTQPDLHKSAIGALGFSAGSSAVVQVAAFDPRIRAVLLEGAYGDADEQTDEEYRPGGRAAQWGARLATYLASDGARTVRPLDIIGRIAPRPLVIVAGDRDRTVPIALSRVLFEAAGPPKALWIIPGARHGTYLRADPTLAGRLEAFFQQSLSMPK